MSVRRGLQNAAIGFAVSLAAVPTASAQELTILDPDYTQLITQEISGDAAYEHIRWMTHYHRPRGGSDGLWKVAEYVEQVASEFGLADVQLIKQASTSRPRWGLSPICTASWRSKS
jgi:hypothetical protein